MKIAIIYNTSEYLIRFRSELIQSLREEGHEVVAITPFDATTQKLEFLKVRWCAWNLAGQSLNPLKDIFSIFSLLRIIASERPDAVLNFTIKPVLYGSLVSSWLGCPRIVSMITGMGSVFLPGGFKRRLLARLANLAYRIAMRCNHKVLFQNDEDLDYFIKKNFISQGKAVRINGSGVNLEKFVCHSNNPTPGSFLLISRMIREKGIYEFISAARKVKRAHPHACFTLVGPIDNNPGAITREEISEWEREGIVRYEGMQADVRPLLSRSEVYVLPTYYLEGVPRSILEALSMGKPIITTDWRGCRDTVIPDVNGFLVPPKDSATLATAMLRFLDDSKLSKKLGSASRLLAEERFNVKDVNNVVIESLALNSRCGTHDAN